MKRRVRRWRRAAFRQMRLLLQVESSKASQEFDRMLIATLDFRKRRGGDWNTVRPMAPTRDAAIGALGSIAVLPYANYPDMGEGCNVAQGHTWEIQSQSLALKVLRSTNFIIPEAKSSSA